MPRLPVAPSLRTSERRVMAKNSYLVVVSYIIKAENESIAEDKVAQLVAYGREETASVTPPTGVCRVAMSPAMQVKK